MIRRYPRHVGQYFKAIAKTDGQGDVVCASTIATREVETTLPACHQDCVRRKYITSSRLIYCDCGVTASQ